MIIGSSLDPGCTTLCVLSCYFQEQRWTSLTRVEEGVTETDYVHMLIPPQRPLSHIPLFVLLFLF